MQASGILRASDYTTKTCDIAVRILYTSGALRYRTDGSRLRTGRTSAGSAAPTVRAQGRVGDGADQR